jgi:hypothetical protein
MAPGATATGRARNVAATSSAASCQDVHRLRLEQTENKVKSFSAPRITAAG